MNINASFTFDRTKWGIKYKSKTFFPELADKFLYDDIEIALNIKAAKEN